MRKKKKRNIFTFLLFWANVLLFISTMLSYLAQYVSPAQIWILAFFGLLYPVFFVLNLFFIFLWLALWRKYIFISIIAILIGFNLIPRFFQFKSTKIPAEDIKTYKIISYNVQIFNFYVYQRTTEHLQKITGLLNDEAPDIVCLQEFYNDVDRYIPIIDTLSTTLRLPYVHFDAISATKKRYPFGIATMSRFPIINKGKLENPNFAEKSRSGNYAIFTDVVIGDDTVRIYNLHLESIRISSEDIIFSHLHNFDTQKIEKHSKNIFSKLKQSFIRRAIQVGPIKEHIENCPYPSIVVGDFNDTPSSYAYRLMSRNLKDAFITSGKGLGTTYVGNYPSFRIDYIFYHPDIEVHNYQTILKEYSDHYPISAVFSLSKNK